MGEPTMASVCERLDRIELLLTALFNLLAEDGDDDVQPPARTLDGHPAGAPREPGQSLG